MSAGHAVGSAGAARLTADGDGPAAGTGRPWAYSAFPVTVAANRRISPGFRRITLAGESLRNFAPWGLDQRIKLVLPMADGSRPDFGLLAEPTPHPRDWYTRWKSLPEDRRNPLRTYTPSRIRPAAGEIDVDVHLHVPAGPASAWAAACAPGDELVITGPDVREGRTGYGLHFTPPAATRRLLLVGDESALPAIVNILGALPAGTTAEVLLELLDPADAVLLDAADDVESGPADAVPSVRDARVRVLRRGAVPGEALEEAVRAWTTRFGGSLAEDPPLYAWLAGETAATARMRRHLTAEAGLDPAQVAFLGYWKLGGPLVG